MNAPTTVPFHNQNLLLIEHNGEPFTVLRPIVDGMGLDWSYQYRKVSASKRWGVAVIATVAEDGKNREMICLPLRKLFGWLMSIQPSRVKPELRDTVIMYQDECDDVLADYWLKGQAINPRIETINPKQKMAIRDAVSKRVSAIYSEGTRSTGFSQVYHDFYKTFDISTYAELPASKFEDAIAYLVGGYIPEEESKALPQEVYNFPAETARPSYKLDDVLNAATLLDERYESPLANLLNRLHEKGHDVNGAVIELKAMRHTLETNATMFASIQDGITTRQQSGLNFNRMVAIA